ncbi:MAG: pilin [Candidatus Saccharimonas sp.]
MRIKLNKDSIVGLLAVPALVLSVAGVMFQAAPAFADPSTEKPPLTVSGGAKSAKGTDQSACLFGNESGCEGTDQTPIFRIVTNVLLFVIGAVSVIMLIIGGFRYVTSQGDQTQVQSAKNTILYSIIGIVVAILAYAAVNFVVSSFVKSE